MIKTDITRAIRDATEWLQVDSHTDRRTREHLERLLKIVGALSVEVQQLRKLIESVPP